MHFRPQVDHPLPEMLLKSECPYEPICRHDSYCAQAPEALAYTCISSALRADLYGGDGAAAHRDLAAGILQCRRRTAHFRGACQFQGTFRRSELVSRFLECIEKQLYILLHSHAGSKPDRHSAGCYAVAAKAAFCCLLPHGHLPADPAVLRDRRLYLETYPVAYL